MKRHFLIQFGNENPVVISIVKCGRPAVIFGNKRNTGRGSKLNVLFPFSAAIVTLGWSLFLNTGIFVAGPLQFILRKSDFWWIFLNHNSSPPSATRGSSVRNTGYGFFDWNYENIRFVTKIYWTLIVEQNVFYKKCILNIFRILLLSQIIIKYKFFFFTVIQQNWLFYNCLIPRGFQKDYRNNNLNCSRCTVDVYLNSYELNENICVSKKTYMYPYVLATAVYEKSKKSQFWLTEILYFVSTNDKIVNWYCGRIGAKINFGQKRKMNNCLLVFVFFSQLKWTFI